MNWASIYEHFVELENNSRKIIENISILIVDCESWLWGDEEFNFLKKIHMNTEDPLNGLEYSKGPKHTARLLLSLNGDHEKIVYSLYLSLMFPYFESSRDRTTYRWEDKSEAAQLYRSIKDNEWERLKVSSPWIPACTEVLPDVKGISYLSSYLDNHFVFKYPNLMANFLYVYVKELFDEYCIVHLKRELVPRK